MNQNITSIETPPAAEPAPAEQANVATGHTFELNTETLLARGPLTWHDAERLFRQNAERLLEQVLARTDAAHRTEHDQR